MITRDELRAKIRAASAAAVLDFVKVDVGAIGEAIVAFEHPDWQPARRGQRSYDFIDTKGRRVSVKTHSVKRGFDDIRKTDVDRVLIVQLYGDEWAIICDRLTSTMFNANSRRAPTTHPDKIPVYPSMHAVEALDAA